MKCCCCSGSNAGTSTAILIAAISGAVVSILGGAADKDDEPGSAPTNTKEVAPMTESDGAKASATNGALPVAHYKSIPAGFAATPSFTPETDPASLKTATFGGGCFWGFEATFRNTPGVTHTAVGFSGGKTPDPSYKEVCYTDTGHAEVVEVLYDPKIVSYDDLLRVFWTGHDPTQVNRQGPDIGEQYRSAIFYHDEAQHEAALRTKAALEKAQTYAGRPIATQIVPAGPFFRAEEYHQQYLEKKGLATCHVPAPAADRGDEKPSGVEQ